MAFYTNCFEQDGKYYFLRDETAIHFNELASIGLQRKFFWCGSGGHTPNPYWIKHLTDEQFDIQHDFLFVFINGLFCGPQGQCTYGYRLTQSEGGGVDVDLREFTDLDGFDEVTIMVLSVAVDTSELPSEDIAVTYYTEIDLLDKYYPVGSYYSTSNSTFDPNTVWGGTWNVSGNGPYVWHRVV